MRPSWLRSLRVRITALATFVVAVTLALVSGVLVWSVERSVVGQVREEAIAEVNRVADALEAGDEHRQPMRRLRSDLSAVSVFVLDEDGELVDTDLFAFDPRIRILDEDVDPRDFEELIRVEGFSLEQIRELVTDELSENADGARAAGVGEGGRMLAAATTDDELAVASRTIETPDGLREVLAVSLLAPAAQSIDAMIVALAVGAPILTVFVAGLTWMAVSRSLRGVEEIRERADVISHSTLGERLPEPRSALELHQLTATLNEMLARLQAGAVRQREFISDASHELHTPLSAMRAELEIALAHAEDADWSQVAQRLLTDHDRIERLTSDLLALARLDDEAPSRSGSPTDLAEVVAVELGAVTLAVETDLAPAPMSMSDAEAARLVRNLLENADRYGKQRIAVTVASRDDGVVLVVEDDGPGVPAADRERIFERFARLDDSRDRVSGGTGLGLALVRRVAEAHGGSVTVTDSDLGGARFEVRLPRR